MVFKHSILPLAVTIFALLLYSCVNSFDDHIFDTKKRECGILYSGSNYTLHKLELPNPKVIHDLRAIGTGGAHNENWDGRASSVLLLDGCKIAVCNGTHLDGNCIWINESTPEFDLSLKNKISSLGCSCPIGNCFKSTCDKVVLRDKECGRAFLEQSCQICDGSFITIRKNHTQTHFGKYEDKVKSLVVNKGCSLTYYTEGDFEGDEHVLDPGIYDDFESTLGSYECDCKETIAKDTTPPAYTPHPDNPPWLDFELTDEGIQALARTYPKHKGLNAALTSIRQKRSPRNAYILILGLTGSGKSSTINFLFENDITAVGAETSTTESINEYRIPVQVDELGCRNCELRVIDTPGFGDTGGLDVDAKFLAGLETYLGNHEELRNRKPNLVLVFSKFSDNRFKGKSSPFVKTLRGIEYFKEKLFDFKYSNALIVLTHFMSEPIKIRKNPSGKMREFRSLIEDYTLFPRPVTIAVAENRPEDQELVMVNGYYLLPNKEYYPQNLFERIQEATEKGGDPIGEAIIRAAFKRPENFKVTEHIFPLKNTTFSREAFFLEELNRKNFNIELTEVSNITERVYEKEIPADLKRKFPGMLQYVQRMLNLEQIYTKEAIPRTTVGILKLFKRLRQNPLVRELLKKSFDLEVPKLEISMVVGQSYNVLKDTVLPETVFNVSSSEGASDISADFGFQIPPIATSSIANDVVNIFSLHATKEDYSVARLSQLKVEGSIKPELNVWETRPGFSTTESFDKTRSITVVKEYRLFQLTLHDKLKLKSDFITRIQTIPPFDASDHEVVQDWKAFFQQFGTHVVSSVFGGGAIQAEFKIKDGASMPSSEARKLIGKSIDDFFVFLEDVYMRKPLAANDINTTHVQYSLRFIGGDFKYSVENFGRLSISGTSELLDGFTESLQFHPAMLETSLDLIPLSTIIKKLGQLLAADKISNATTALLNSTLIYVPPPPAPPPLERPEVQKVIKEMRAKLELSIAELSKELAESQLTFANFTRELLKQKNKEREEMAKQILKAEEDALNNLNLTCIYEQGNLKGKTACNAVADMCVCIQMKTMRSINTHNSCVHIYKDCGCTGTATKHVSNITHNNRFPFDMSSGGRISLANCLYVPLKATKIEIIISFDTTGSMFSYLTTVRRVIKEMLSRLTTTIPSIRMGILAHGDYSDKSLTYVTKAANSYKLCGSTQVKHLVDFVTNVGSTYGGDGPECYELVLKEVRTKFDWSVDSHKSLIMIGDDLPHEASYHLNTEKINWRTEAQLLKEKGVKVHTVQANTGTSATSFYKELARITGGSYLNLQEFSATPDLLTAVALSEADAASKGSSHLKKFAAEITAAGKMGAGLKKAVDTLLLRVD